MFSSTIRRFGLGLVCAAIAVTAAACKQDASAPPNQPAAAPVVNASADDKPHPSTSAAPESTTSVKPMPEPKVLGPTGLGALKLGMTADQAYATGVVAKPIGSKGCDLRAVLATGKGVVRFDESDRVSAIPAMGDTATPEGIRLGSTVKQLMAAYPGYRAVDRNMEADDRGYTDVPGNEHAHYRVEARHGVVISLTLEAEKHGCYE